MKGLRWIEWGIIIVCALILLTLYCTRVHAGEPPTPAQVDKGAVVNILRGAGYSDSLVGAIVQVPFVEELPTIPPSKEQAAELVRRFSTSLVLGDNGRWIALCTLNMNEDEDGWHICMDVQVLYPKVKK